ncbi:MAG: acyl-CoA dehydrogenase family protein, partial [Chloroflexota bacterium]|nr:acyl-CoA dehydrogenase family protein [Chloroflexota bacterium]
GWDYIREALDLDRTSGITYGHLPLRLAELIEYVKSSTLNGRPLIDDPWVRDRIAQFVIEVEAGELLQGMTASKIAADLRLRMESSIVKVFLTEMERRMGEFAMEVSGPLASLTPDSEDAPAGGQFYWTHRSNPGITIAGGSNEIQRNIIAQQGLGLPRA